MSRVTELIPIFTVCIVMGVGCDSGPTSTTRDDPHLYVRGEVTYVVHRSDGVSIHLGKVSYASGNAIDAAVVHTKESTPVTVIEADGSVRAGKLDDVAVGVVLKAWVEDVELRSLAVQLFATSLQIDLRTGL